ncbi:MAG: hypothetical protein FJW20_02905 [Acidimicrobiia bacterium]|nr:hypothetical protein [Acidimicrobiia bacterium]
MAAGAAPAAAQVEIRLHFTALERMLASQVFTEEGRKFVKGKTEQQCNFAYLEKPRVGHEQSRLRIRARFTGRSAIDLFGKCVGLGDSFDLTIFTHLHYKEGSAVFRNVMVESYGKDSFYKRRVRQTIARSMERDLRYPLAAEARRVLEQGGARTGYKPELSNFDVSSIEVTPSAVVFRLRFHLDVK